MKKNRKLKIIEWNCNSILSKLELLKQFIRSNKPDILLLSETKCSSELASFQIKIIGYDLIIKPRQSNPNFGGGVAILVSKKLKYSEINEFDHTNAEFLAIKTKIQNHETLICTLYKPPNVDLNKNLFEEISRKYAYFIIGGDLNSKLIEFGNKVDNNDGHTLNQILETCNCSIINDKSPTYFEPRVETDDYSEILDLFICSNNLISKVNNFSVHNEAEVLVDVKYHCPIELTIHGDFFKNEKNREVTLNYSKANWELYRGDLSKISIDPSNLNEEELEKTIRKHIVETANQSIPPIKPSTFITSLPPDIVNLIKQKKEIRRELNKKSNRKNTNLKADFNKLCKKIKFKVYQHKLSKWQEFIERESSSIQFWRRINRIRSN